MLTSFYVALVLFCSLFLFIGFWEATLRRSMTLKKAENLSFQAARELDKKLKEITEWATYIAEEVHLGTISETEALKKLKESV